MTPADEAKFIQLWPQGLETTAIAQRLGIPRGTMASRAHTLVRQGKIQSRPRGGAYPRQKAQARQDESSVPVQRPVQSTDTGAVHGLDRLEDEVQSLSHLVQAMMDRLDHPPV